MLLGLGAALFLPLGCARELVVQLVHVRAVLPLLLKFLLSFLGSWDELGRVEDAYGRVVGEFDQGRQPEGEAEGGRADLTDGI